MIKSLQRGTITVGNGSASGTGTITSVVTANTRVAYLGVEANGTTNTDSLTYITLTNATTVTATRNGTSGAEIVSYEVIEYVPGVIKSVQLGTITTTASSATGTITTVVTLKTQVDNLGNLAVSANNDQSFVNLALTNATTITLVKVSAGSSVTGSYQAVEWF